MSAASSRKRALSSFRWPGPQLQPHQEPKPDAQDTLRSQESMDWNLSTPEADRRGWATGLRPREAQEPDKQ